MTRLTAALSRLGLVGEIALDGRWITLRGERCLIYVAEPTKGGKYLSWCGHPHERAVELFDDPVAAIEAGLYRAKQTGAANDV